MSTWWEREKNNVLVYLIIGFTMLIANPTSQFFTIYQRDLGMSLSFVGIIAAAAAMFDMLGRFAAGVFSDRKGRKRPLLFLVLGAFLFPLLMLFFDSPAALLAIKSLYALTNAAFWTVIIAYLYDTNGQEKGGRIYAKAIMALFIVNLISPLIGGFVIEHFGYRWLFSLSCYLVVVPLVLVFFLKNPKVQRQSLSVQGEVMDILEKPRFMKVWTVLTIASFSGAFIGTFFPIFLKEQLGLSYVQVGLFFSLGTVVLIAVQPFAGWLADRFKSKIVIPANLLLMSLGLLILSFFSQILIVFFAKTIVPVGIFGSRTKGIANIAKMTPNEEHALALAIMKSSSGIGWAIMMTVSPTLIASFGYIGVFRALSIITAAAAGWYYVAYKKQEYPTEEGFLEHFQHHHLFHFADTHMYEQVHHRKSSKK